MRNSPGDTPIGAGWLVVLHRSRLRAAFPHLLVSLWSHSCWFKGVRSGLPGPGSGAMRPNRTVLNHPPQNSKAREGQPSAGSNPADTAGLIRPNARRAARWTVGNIAVLIAGRAPMRFKLSSTAVQLMSSDLGPRFRYRRAEDECDLRNRTLMQTGNP
jgi:hypothetical protein